MTGKMLVIACFDLLNFNEYFKYDDNNMDKCYNENREIK